MKLHNVQQKTGEGARVRPTRSRSPMQYLNCRVIALACLAVIVAGSNAAFARPSHHHHHRSTYRSAHHHHSSRHHYARRVRADVQQSAQFNPYYAGPGSVQPYAFADDQATPYAPRRVHARHRRGVAASAAPAAGFGGVAGSSLVADARRYLGTNPTGRRSLWCGAFMDKVLRDTGHRGGGNLARGYLHYGTRLVGPAGGRDRRDGTARRRPRRCRVRRRCERKPDRHFGQSQ